MNKRTYEPNTERPARGLRRGIQIAFVALCLWIGIEFHLFVAFLEAGGVGENPGRPPGVEAFLPISALMSVYYFMLSGEIHPVHPAGFFIFLAIVAASFVIGKSFCAAICPVGLLSEKLGDLGRKLFGRRVAMPRWIDYPLRSIKYLLLGFFAYSIFFLMTAASLKAFLDGGYNIVSDIRMYDFFAQISRFALWVIVGLAVLSVIFRSFWCRYLCPYGALLGVFSLLSPSKITRNVETCIGCEQCTGACPSRIRVHATEKVYSDECIGCLQCADACPVADTVQLQWILPGMRWKWSKKWALATAAGIFVTITGLGMASGFWQNDITVSEYLHHYAQRETYDHIRGPDDIDALNQEAEQGQSLIR